MIIDSHSVYTGELVSFLQELSFEDIYTAETGEQGLEFVKSGKPNLILLSAVLPDLDGLEICRIVGTLTDQSARIIVQIGLCTEDEMVNQFKACGADVVLLRKEKDLEPLHEAIDRLLFNEI